MPLPWLDPDPIVKPYFSKCFRTFAAIWRSVILSTVSMPTMRPPRLFFLKTLLQFALGLTGTKDQNGFRIAECTQ